VFAEVDETIRQLLIDHVPLDLDEVDVSFDAPDREWSARLSRPTVNCFLYDVRQNLERRDAEWTVTRNPRTNTVTRKQGPLRVDATYYMTVWARMPEDEHRLLWRVFSVLARFPVLPREILAGELQDQPYPLQARVADPSEQHTSATDLWQALDNRVRPSLSYVLTLTLDPQLEFESPIVLTRVARVRTTLHGTGGSQEYIYQRGTNAANQHHVDESEQSNKPRTSKRRAKS
jgi:hypothetical protein